MGVGRDELVGADPPAPRRRLRLPVLLERRIVRERRRLLGRRRLLPVLDFARAACHELRLGQLDQR